MAIGHPRYTAEEVGRRAHEIYDRSIRNQVEREHRGRYLVLDIETEEYLIADDYLTPSTALLARRPEAALFAFRIGYPALGRMGGTRWRSPE